MKAFTLQVKNKRKINTIELCLSYWDIDITVTDVKVYLT